MERDGLCRRTLDRLLEGCQIIGRDFRYLYVNDVVVRHARQPREALIGRTMMEVYPGIDETPLFDVIRRVMQGGAPEHLENFFEFPDGTSGWFELSVQPVPDGVCILSIDITERVTAQRLSHRRQRLESLGTLAGGVAHDLNNALSPITMSIGLLRDAGGADEDLLASVEESAGRAARLVRQLLTFSKGSDGERLPVHPQHLIEEMDRFIRRSFPKAIATDIRVDDSLPDVRGDSTQLHQVLLNLCINARDAMPHGGTLTLEATVTDIDAAYASAVLDGRPGRFVCLIVRDTGAGIPPEALDRIFEPFFTTKGPDSGTGLGLSTTLGIVRSHGGFMHVYSEPGRGTTFRVFLPVTADPPPGAGRSPGAPAARQRPHRAGG